ncbi:MAG: glycosyltransferase [Alphaproteobacteria bacterium]|nr:glycosyltransferase [Alphaproteobacteria bacterium]
MGIVAAILAPMLTASLLAAIAGLYYVASATFKVWLSWRGLHAFKDADTPFVPEDLLPVYTILAPMRGEAGVLPAFVASMRALDYPVAKLDIKILLEADDAPTIAAARAHAAGCPFDIIVVPVAAPRTKPKALNIGLQSARGGLITVYDAEDAPEPLQLREAAATFGREAQDCACLQARLNFYNARENPLTRLFALEYALWFDVMQPGLASRALPIPLGGTSNHFRTRALKEAGGWDPFNVTEDADLGLRLARLGLKVGVLPSTTFEEACPTLSGWLRQRTRWMKGFMVTYLVHMRDPLRLWRELGGMGFFSVQLFLGGAVACALINPVFWLLFAVSAAGEFPAIAAVFAPPVALISTMSLFAGNAALVFLSLLAPLRRGWWGLIPFAVLTPLYWMLISLAAYLALLELASSASYWAKTEHGVSRVHPQARRA